jgi:hypothetical protein
MIILGFSCLFPQFLARSSPSATKQRSSGKQPAAAVAAKPESTKSRYVCVLVRRSVAFIEFQHCRAFVSSAGLRTVQIFELPVVLCASRVSTGRSSDVLSKLLLPDASSSESVELAVVYQSPTGEGFSL